MDNGVTFAESVPVCVVAANGAGHVSFINQMAADLLGIAPADALDKPVRDLLRLRSLEHDKPFPLPSIRSFSGQPQPRNLGILRLTAAGHQRLPVRVRIGCLTQDGHLRGTIVLFEDASAELRAAEERLTRCKLDVVTSMAGNVAGQATTGMHDIATHACTITDHYSRGTLAHDEAGAILAQIRHCNAMYHRLQTLATAAATTAAAVQESRCRPDQLVQSALDLLRQSFENRCPAIQVAVSVGALPAVTASKRHLTDALGAILTNAAEATGPGGRVHIDGATRQIDGQPFVVLRVRDNGGGMDADTRRRACDPFFTTHPHSPERGLGLTLASSAIESCGGMLKLRSQVGHGTSVRVFLRVNTQGTPGGTRKVRRPQDLHVLLVDDSPDHLDDTRTALENAGFVVHAALTSTEGMALYDANAEHINIAIVDAFMPKEGGRALFDHIRQQSSNAHILLVSGFSRDFVRNYMKRDGWTYLQKPLTQEQLVSAIQRAVESVES